MKSRWPLVSALAIVAVVMPSIALAPPAQADEASQRKNLTVCTLKELDKENSEFQLKAQELSALKEIISNQIHKQPLRPHTSDEQAAILKEIEAEAKVKMPAVPTSTIDKMVIKLRDLALHCNTEMGS
ncbi:hypothetical protein ACFWF7_01320 [Nocardia sp. NPDC060256]|uniref:hypothetical protein n=1 Tax=unclassified Nocardia TaxID=2637762 RepID=UPI003648E308